MRESKEQQREVRWMFGIRRSRVKIIVASVIVIIFAVVYAFCSIMFGKNVGDGV
ncbi:hypothetical protein IJJ37_02820 [Candidatus Saccharibacteria bacterium]|nr:hypothetical protein [Candidatus Saccharibacteria bacterium]